ncbi:dihydrofolate reductase family protein [Thalassotalea sp. PS06]|uniref:dihydrofolate reductase family protein n=1 Tax=Thalassotalea sp. PS06 TaxID=2594005 RepID=UPI00116224D6|nr:dihydrofolate reductase family protein [Thalassotalea sp. PS06]QDO99916.1 dihydrofolate reductase [Thalassotalea sp. PS06]
MQLQCSAYIAISVDGFIAGEGGDLSWLNEANALVPQGEDCGFAAFMGSIDYLVMGRHTYEKVLSFGGDWVYSKPVIVLSSRFVSIPDHLKDKVSASSQPIAELCLKLANKGARRIYVDGGYTIRQFIDAGLLTDIELTLIPILIGKGIPLFNGLQQRQKLKLVNSNVYDFGFVQLKYEVDHGS